MGRLILRLAKWEDYAGFKELIDSLNEEEGIGIFRFVGAKDFFNKVVLKREIIIVECNSKIIAFETILYLEGIPTTLTLAGIHKDFRGNKFYIFPALVGAALTPDKKEYRAQFVTKYKERILESFKKIANDLDLDINIEEGGEKIIADLTIKYWSVFLGGRFLEKISKMLKKLGWIKIELK